MRAEFGIRICLGLIYSASLVRSCPPPFHFQNWTDVYQNPPPEAFMNTPQLIQNYNYPVETHEVTTLDGYILTVFRIPYSNKTADRRVINKEPILVQHGLVCSSNDWFVLKPESNLPFMLADLGFDVWLGNCRGNEYSQRHTNYTIEDIKYWDFRQETTHFHEMGIYDIPAVIKYILAKTGKEKMSYVGHSMGTTMFFIAMDRHRELQAKIRKMVSLSPVAYLSHVKTPLGLLSLIPSAAYTEFNSVVNAGRIFYEPFNKFLNDFGPYLCSGNFPSCLCQNIMFFMTGFDYSQCTTRTASMVAGHTPSDASGKTLVHYLQWVRSGVFQEYDYGLVDNLLRYGSPVPPRYNLSVNHVETFAMYSMNDWLIQPADAERAIKELGNVTSMKVVWAQFSHLDFTYATDVKKEVYDHCIEFLLA